MGHSAMCLQDILWKSLGAVAWCVECVENSVGCKVWWVGEVLRSHSGCTRARLCVVE